MICVPVVGEEMQCEPKREIPDFFQEENILIANIMQTNSRKQE